MNKIKNDRILKTIRREKVDCTPIWIMRQAGRYLPEYRKIRESAGSFMALCKTPELACEVTLQPLKRFPLDAAILFSDILTIPDAMGLGLHFVEGEGPRFTSPVRTKKEIESLNIPEPETELNYVLETIRLIKKELADTVPLIGFCGSPWTLATYMIEGSANKAFPLIKNMRADAPQLLHSLLSKLTLAIAKHLIAQAKHGADVLMIFDTWGGLLDKENYLAFSLFYMQEIIRLIKEENKTVPIILFTKGGSHWVADIATSGCDVIGLDWEANLNTARQQAGNKIALQGNLNPKILYESPQIIENEVARTLKEFGTGSGHIFNLGHGIMPDVPFENVSVLVEAVHKLSRQYHG